MRSSSPSPVIVHSTSHQPPQPSLHDKEHNRQVIRIGKFLWPPPVKSEPRIERNPNRLDIQETVLKKSDDRQKNQYEVNRTSEVIGKIKRQESTEPSPKSPKPAPIREPPIRINMTERQQILEEKLGKLYNKNKKTKTEKKTKTVPPSPPPPVIVLTEKPRPPPLKIEPPPVAPPIEREDPETPVDLQALEIAHTHLFCQCASPFLMYNRVNWSLEVRKELFTPQEKVQTFSPMLIQLIFMQVVNDVNTGKSIRVNKDEKLRVRRIMDTYNVTSRNLLSVDQQIQLQVIEEAMEWPCYFSRIFPVTGGSRHPRVRYVAVSHAGVYLLTRVKDLIDDQLTVLEHYRFENIRSVAKPQPYTVQLQVTQYKYIILYTHKAIELRSLIDAFCIECESNEMYVRARQSYRTRESTLLSFDQDEIIKLTNRNMTMDRGWLYGSIHGRAGMFPRDHVETVAMHVATAGPQRLAKDPPATRHHKTRDGSITSTTSSLMLHDGTFTMLEFAMKYFRKSPYIYTMSRGEGGSIHGTFKEISAHKMHSIERKKKKKGNWTWKDQVDMIKWTRSPIQVSLLELNKEDNKMALECFISIMRYMGDYPMGKDMRQVDCVLFLLMQCHNRRVIIDEIFCQLIKQTTNNRSSKSDSEMMGWRMLAIFTAFFDVTDKLQPYMFKYLETVAYDNARSGQALAALSLDNARKTLKYGGRRNVPSKVELDAITRGRISKRQVCVLPGGAPVLLNIKSSNVVADMLDQICSNLDIYDSLETEEYTIFYVIEKENHYCPLSSKEYIFDITTELENQGKTYYLLFQRTSWIFPLRLEPSNHMYIDVMYHQCIPDYIDGFMMSVPNKTLPTPVKEELAYLGALLLRVMEKKGTPNHKDTAAVIPKIAHSVGDVKLGYWANQIYHRLFEVIDISPEEAKIRFLEKLSSWPLFGSTFFNVKSVSDKRVVGACRLAINKHGINCLNIKTNETLVVYPLEQIISTRRASTDRGKHLDVKVGDLLQHKTVQIVTEQSSDIGALINQYIALAKETLNTR